VTATAARPAAASSVLGHPVTVGALRYTYTGTTRAALDGVDLGVAPGEFVCLLGPSGCGKTTLLRLIAGLLRPTDGRVERGSPNSGIGWMAQRDGLLPWRRVVDNVLLPLQLLGRPGGVAQAAARGAIERVGLGTVAALYPHQLSGGMRQRVALARAVVHEPELLLLDEPFAHLDELTRDDLGDELVRVWADRRPTIIMVTHSVLEAARLADRVVVLSTGPGRVVGEIEMEAQRPRQETDAEVVEASRYLRALLRGRE
jgi:NitT/TauT family transport system ATP-binding protein